MDHQHHKEHHHEGHDHSAMMADSAGFFLRRFWTTTILLIPLVLVSGVGVKYLGIPDFAGREYIGFGISAIIFYYSFIFFEHASHEIKSRQYGMMTLVSIAVASGFLFSVASTFLPYFEGVEFYLEISTLIWVLLFGHYLEARSTAAAGSALKEVAKLLPKKVHLVHGNETHDVDISEIKVGDTVLVKPGEKIPADGIILKGSANTDESLITGESKSINKKTGQQVVAGSICLDGSLYIKIEKTGSDSTVGQIQKLIEQAQITKPKLQNIADKVSSWLTFFALFVAIVTMLVWTLLAGQTIAFSLTLAVTVLVIACPHALGLAIPAVSTIATSLALKNGIFVKNLKKLEMARNITVVAFDKTGTLTEGKPAIVDIVTSGNKDELLKIAASLEAESSHPLAIAIVDEAKNKNIETEKITNFKNLAGYGIVGNIEVTKYYFGNRALVLKNKLFLGEYEQEFEALSKQGKTVMVLTDTKKVLGLISVADKIRAESKEAIAKLHNQGVKVAMITGDNEGVAEYVSKELGIDTYFAGVLPEDKYKKIKELQEKGNTVMMVGDGVNDAPALIQANVGVAIGTGTDVTIEAGDIILTKNNPADIPKVLNLSKKVYGKMVQNLVWAFGYNIVAIPAAAGVFAGAGIFLRPEMGAFLMSLSTVIVVVNALQLKKVKL